MVTTIQVSKELINALKTKKMFERESYEDVIWDLLEDTAELSEQTVKDIEEAEADIKAGRVLNVNEVRQRLGL